MGLEIIAEIIEALAKSRLAGGFISLSISIPLAFWIKDYFEKRKSWKKS